MQTNTKQRVSTGLTGLDEILCGGLITRKAYLLRGGPGTGKSTIGYRFLEQGSKNGEKSLLITLSESKESAFDNASSVNIDMGDITILDLSPQEQIYKEAQSYDVFPASDVESVPLVESIVNAIEEIRPKRVLLDSVSMLKYMHQDPYQYRNMILSFIRYICNKGATVLMIAETEIEEKNNKVAFWVDGIINVRYTPGWRRINVTKYRGSEFLPGDHSFKLSKKGPQVFSKIEPNTYNRRFQNRLLSVGIDEMDDLLGGGIEKGSINLLSGPTGAGKTSLGAQFIKESTLRNERSTIYTFEESADIILKRSKSIGIDLEKPVNEGKLSIVPVEPLSYSPDEFANIVRKDVEQNDTEVVMIDSIGGFSLSFLEESNHLRRLHALCIYLQNVGVTGILTNEIDGESAAISTTQMNASYLVDNIIYIKYVELNAELRKIIGVLKKRLSNYERTIREFQITKEGIKIGEPMRNFEGLLTGTPTNIQ